MARTIAQLTSAGQPFPAYETMAENQARLDFIQDQERYVHPFRDQRKPCDSPACAHLTTDQYCSPACQAREDRLRDKHYAHLDSESTLVLLGNCHLADAQREKDGENLAALVCGRTW
jgi:hypothetical protein